jgi:sulfite exporter TauE/SafE
MSPLVFNYVSQLFYTFVNELHLMPLMVLAAKMCPKQVEASFYAFVLAVINLGYLVSYQLGGILTYSLGITATKFSNMWILVVLASVFPLVTQVLLLCLPEKYDVNEEISKYFHMRRERKQQ